MKKKEMRFILILILLVTLSAIVSLVFLSVFFSSLNIKNPMFPEGYIHLSKNDILVSFQIDDINFASGQELTLDNALFLARKYNITFDLGVIARQFEQQKNDDIFRTYQDNQNVFEVVAHGLTHAPDPSIYSMYEYGAYGEFDIVPAQNESVPANVQQEKIKEMRDIFLKNDLIMATKIFSVPYHKGDENTINISEAYGYKLIFEQLSGSKNYSTRNYGKIIASEDYIEIPQASAFSDKDVINYNQELNKAINLGQNRIVISMHPVNFDSLDDIDNFMGEIINEKNYNPRIKFGMVSNTIYN